MTTYAAGEYALLATYDLGDCYGAGTSVQIDLHLHASQVAPGQSKRWTVYALQEPFDGSVAGHLGSRLTSALFNGGDTTDGGYWGASVGNWVLTLTDTTDALYLVAVPTVTTVPWYSDGATVVNVDFGPDLPPVDCPEPPDPDVTPEPPYEAPGPAGPILEIYLPDPDASRWGTATWDEDATPGPTDEGIWSGSSWQDVTPEGVVAQVTWGADRADLGILTEQAAGVWDVRTFDPERKLDPGNPDSPYYPHIVPTTPIRINHRNVVVRTGEIEDVRFRLADTTGMITATDSIALLARTLVPDTSDLDDDLRARVDAVLTASGLNIPGMALAPVGNPLALTAAGTSPALSPQIDGEYSAWHHIRKAAQEAMWVVGVDRRGRLTGRAWGKPLDRGGTLAADLMIDLTSYMTDDGRYGEVRALNATGTTTSVAQVIPVPRYGIRVYERTETTQNSAGWVAAVLGDRAFGDVRWDPGEIRPDTADDVEMLALIELNERVRLLVPSAVDVTGRVLGGEFSVIWNTGSEGPTWRWRFTVATIEGPTSGATFLVDDATGGQLLDDVDEDYIVEDA